jgi:hypothetical protein
MPLDKHEQNQAKASHDAVTRRFSLVLQLLPCTFGFGPPQIRPFTAEHKYLHELTQLFENEHLHELDQLASEPQAHAGMRLLRPLPAAAPCGSPFSECDINSQMHPTQQMPAGHTFGRSIISIFYPDC